MRPRHLRTCTYVVVIDAVASGHELQTLAGYLSSLGSAACEVVVLDPASGAGLEARKRILRWVGRHVPVIPHHRLPGGGVDVLQVAVDLASTEKIIVAGSDSRYTPEQIASICQLLDRFEAIEPEEFVQPLPWWGGIDAARMLLQRGLDQAHGEGRTFAFRRAAWRPPRGLEERERESHLRRLVMQGADVQPARAIFVRREPPPLSAWLREQGRTASAELAVPLATALFAGILPLLILMGLLGGGDLATSYAGLIGLASVVVAARGRSGARNLFPLHAPLFAPIWIAKRSLSVYWALFDRLRVRKHATITARPAPGDRSEAANR